MNPDEWPHQFTKNGRGYEMGINEDGTTKYAQTYVCVHCYREYVQGLEQPPANPCSARNTKRELVRLKK